ncbi:MAG: hypothetical protein K2X77_11795 [Candidatus Obscuribacterales bacterium]|jgi:hypothetical protein|nr:hypothetical protein [Candidatus Obscuribacterales bacterium]
MLKALNAISMVPVLASLTLLTPAYADVTLSGSQIRGKGSNGQLISTGVVIQNPGTIVKANDAGAGFWLQSASGKIRRFNKASDSIGTIVEPGTWYAYPNIYQNQDRAGVWVLVSTGSGTSSSAVVPSGGGSAVGPWKYTTKVPSMGTFALPREFKADGSILDKSTNKIDGFWVQEGEFVYFGQSPGQRTVKFQMSPDGTRLKPVQPSKITGHYER